MGQDPNQPYSGQYGQPSGAPPQGGYQGGYQQQGAYPPPNTDYQQSGYNQSGYQQPNPGGYQQYQQPNPGGYQQYQQPYGQPAGPSYNTDSPLGATTVNMEPNTAAGLSYFTWVAGLIFFLMEKQNRFVRFNAMQELLLTASGVALYIALTILAFIPFLGLITLLLEPLLGIGLFVLWLICVINAFQGKYFKLPLIGDYAERWANPGVPGAPMM